jgi:23S rRNA pseudouridine1911/1915/1917 synthase
VATATESPDGSDDSPEQPLQLRIGPEQAGQRADKALHALLRAQGMHITRAELQRWMADGKVTADGKPVDRSAKLKNGALLTVVPAPPPLSEALPDPAVHFGLVHEDEHLLVVDKPAGLVVHPARGHADGTLVNGLLALPGFAADNADPRDPAGYLRPGIVHRLDKDTSGLLVVAKDARTREGLKALFQSHDIERSYRAIAGAKARSARFDTTHGRHPSHRLRFTSKLAADRPGVRRAVTIVERLESVGPLALVRCELETGRTHQIRVHLAEQALAPIFADTLYGGMPRSGPLRPIAEQLGRQALHAGVLGFVHPISGEQLHFESPLPADMQQAIEALRALT